jgi:RNA polymerase sigma factor (sigma-70 family)
MAEHGDFPPRRGGPDALRDNAYEQSRDDLRGVERIVRLGAMADDQIDVRDHLFRDIGVVVEPQDPSESNQPGHALEMAEEERRLHQALRRLSPEHRSVLVLKDMEGMKYEEMAVVLEVPVGTIRSRLHRARLELREILLQEEGEPA